MHRVFVAAFSLGLAACGGAAKSGEPPKSPPPAGAAPATTPELAEGSHGKAANDLEAAQRELDVAAGDCGAACKALASMDRAAAHLCAIASTADEHAACEDAKAKVLRARDKVRSTCGICAGGPNGDRNAPIPSGP